MDEVVAKNSGIVIFGEHTIVDQWHALSRGEGNFFICRNYQELSNFDPNKNTVIFFKTNTRESVKTALIIKLKGFRVIKFWTGTDVLNLQNLTYFKKIISLFLIKKCVGLHLTNGTWLTEELQALKIVSHQWVSPTPLYFDAKEIPLKELQLKKEDSNKTVLIYSNEGREWLYNTKLMLEIAQATPQLNFIFIGNNALNTDYLPNTESLGVVTSDKMVKLYKTSHVLLRITEHDGFPRMVIEALYFGLDVIFNNPIPHTTLCSKNIDEIKNILSSNKTLETNVKGRNYALTEFSAKKWIKDIQEYTKILRKEK